ncbi:uncharacterized protein LOC110702794 [Chenopodium quinoa]|uniref:uncharacterized protein LOC110702794 n=1 Tax=Chenopodium quinoa TaxID=63459 RepID=UPI000B7989BD|nr:uncharacterized protein LOC110702794 [Chenopodium quinoa]
MLQDYDGSYRTKPWKKIGPKSMIDAINLLHEADANDLANVSVYVDAVEIFYVHICEAARLYVIESFVCTSLKPSGVGNFTQRIYEDEESFILPGDKNQTIESEFDVYSLVKGDGPIDFELSINPPNYIEFFIKKFKLLSKVWLTYSLSGRRIFEMKPEDVSKLHLRSKKSLRSCLAVLCNTNLDKILSEWQKKSKNNHATVTPAVFEEMVRLVRELQKQKKVLL